MKRPRVHETAEFDEARIDLIVFWAFVQRIRTLSRKRDSWLLRLGEEAVTRDNNAEDTPLEQL